MMVATCNECGRVFDLSDETDAAEWHYGHDCEVMVRCAGCDGPVDAGDGVAINGLAFCGNYYGDGCGDRVLRSAGLW